jgi:CubicO group peptidase (beta-lactamase class C family)
VSLAATAGGTVAPGFEEVRATFEHALSTRESWSGAVAAYVHGDLVVDLWGGPDYQENSLQYVYSATKGAAAICLALQLERGLLNPDAPVSSYWPEFAAKGKEDIPVRWVLSHQAGLAGVDGGYSLAEYIAHAPVAEKLAAQEPLWRPGSGHGYHALTFGTLVDELSLRVTGMRIGEFFVTEIPALSTSEFFIGLPESEDHRVVPGNPLSEADSREWPNQALLDQTLNIGADFPALDEMETLREVRAAALPAVSGICSARGLAQIYATCISEVGGFPPLLNPETVERVSAVQVDGPDLILPQRRSFGLGFQLPADDELPFAGPGSFGHDGRGGSLGYASPRHGLAFGFITNQTPAPFGGADQLTTDLTHAILSCLELVSSDRPQGAPH